MSRWSARGRAIPELLTLRAVRALRSADVILFDDLVAPEILDFARREAKRMLVGKTGYAPSCKQDDINALMVGLAKSGKRVVRLKSGDPMIFGRAGEEIAALASARHSCRRRARHHGGARRRCWPQGVADAAENGAAGAVHHRPRPQRPAAGRPRSGRTAPTRRRRPPSTCRSAPCRDLVERLLEAGIEPDRPVTAIFNATRPDEHVVRSHRGDNCSPRGCRGGRRPLPRPDRRGSAPAGCPL